MSQPARKRAPSAGRRVQRSPLADILDQLEAKSDQLSEQMLQRYLDTIPSYRSLPDETLRQVREVNDRNIRGFIEAMRGSRGPAPAELKVIRESAVRRAREGVPLSALLAAYRSGGQLAWYEARNIIGTDPTLLSAGLDFATAVMRWIDEASGAAAQAYLSEYERLTSDREAARRDFIDGALSGALSADEILARAEALGLDSQSPYSVALIGLAGGQEDEAVLRGAQHRLRSMSSELPNAERSLVVARGTEVAIAFIANDGDEAKMAEQLRDVVARAGDSFGAPLRAGVGRARTSIAEIAGSYREASIALTAARAESSGPVAVYGEVLVEELILRERSVARRLAQTILEPLNDHPDLRATLVEYMAHGPSLPAVAKRLFLHPNTVAYRLVRVKELTGRDPKSPAGVAELFLALRAAQLVGVETTSHL